VQVGNTLQIPTTDYTAVGTALTFAATAVPADSSAITVVYRAGSLQTVTLDTTSFNAGSEASPTINHVSQNSTGIYFPSTSRIGFCTNGNERVEINNSTTASSTTTGALQVAGGVGMTGKLYVGGIVNATDTTQATGTASGALIVSGGAGIAKNCYVGGDMLVTGDFTVNGTFTTTGTDSLEVNDPLIFTAANNSGDAVDQGLIMKYNDGSNTRRAGLFRDVTDGKFKIFDNLIPAPTTTVDTTDSTYAAGDLVVGNMEVTLTTSSSDSTSGALIVSGGVGIAKTLNVGEDVVAYASSDERYKDLITPIENPNEKIKLLSGNTFVWNDKHEVFKGKKDIGVIAQEVEKVLPEIVETRDNGYKAVKYEKIVALLIESNKELIKRVEELESKIK